MAKSKEKSNADVVTEIHALITKVRGITADTGGDFDAAAKSRLIETLQQVARELDDCDPAIVSIREARCEAEKCGTQEDLDILEADIQALLEKQAVTLFPRDLFKATKDLGLFAFFWLALGSIPILLVGIGALLPLVPSGASSVAGTIGDAFGMSNAFFSGLALLFVAATMYLQRKELMLQRNELRLTRDEMRRSSDSQGEQARRLEAAARIASLSHIYHHYDTFTTTHSQSRVAQAVASGKKRWAIRHLHMLIEPDAKFRSNRLAEIAAEDAELVELLRSADLAKAHTVNEVEQRFSLLITITMAIAALMADESIDPTRRELMYHLYDVLWDYDETFKKLATDMHIMHEPLSEPQKQWLKRFSEKSNAIIEMAN